MKFIKKEDLLLILQADVQKSYDLHDLEVILDIFGDDWFIVDGKWEKVKENEAMKQIREDYQVEKEGA